MTIEQIQSPSNPRIKAAHSLRDSRQRRDDGLIIIDGDSTARHASAGGIEIIELFMLQTADESHRLAINDWQELCPQARINVCAGAAMKKIQYGDREAGLIAIARTPQFALESLDDRIRPTTEGQRRIFLVLDQMEKPGNLGAALRTADAAGVSAVLLSDPVCEPWNPNAIRASLGAVFRVPIAVGSAKQVRSWLIERGIAMFTTRVDGSLPYSDVRYPRQTAIIVGSESHGLDTNWNAPEIQSIRIPMQGAIDSLNVSVSTAIVLFEAIRSR